MVLMDNIAVTQDFNDSCPDGGTARLAAMTSVGMNSRATAANLSIALAGRGKHVCLITTDPASGNSRGAPLEELFAGRKLLAEILSDDRSGTQTLSVGSAFANFFHMDGNRQQMLVELLTELESAFDYLIVETASEADEGLLRLYQSVPVVLLALTPEADSLTSAFSLLRALKRQQIEPLIHVIVEMAGNLPDAHDTFKKLQHAASKYLQLEPHYLGYLPARQPVQSCAEQNPTVAASCHPDSITASQWDAIVERFCAIAETVLPVTSLSAHFSELCSECQLTDEESDSTFAADIGMVESAERPALSTPYNPGGWHERLSDRIALYDAAHYASMLATREARE